MSNGLQAAKYVASSADISEEKRLPKNRSQPSPLNARPGGSNEASGVQPSPLSPVAEIAQDLPGSRHVLHT